MRFGLGATLAFRRETIERLGGFRPLREFVGDDYVLGARIAASGLRVEVSSVPVVTRTGPNDGPASGLGPPTALGTNHPQAAAGPGARRAGRVLCDSLVRTGPPSRSRHRCGRLPHWRWPHALQPPSRQPGLSGVPKRFAASGWCPWPTSRRSRSGYSATSVTRSSGPAGAFGSAPGENLPLNGSGISLRTHRARPTRPPRPAPEGSARPPWSMTRALR